MKFELTADLKKGTLHAFGRKINISCIVRNETNNRRKDEVVRSIPKGLPIQPRTFPKGTWKVERPLARTSDYLKPFFIPTDAWQDLPVWELDNKGNYKMPTDVCVRDSGYGMHYSTSRTTQGCIRILIEDDLLFLVEQINKALDNKDAITLTVV